MLIAERHRLIADMTARERFVRTEEIADTLGVSAETVRRDLIALEKRHLLVRVHGGASAPSAVETDEAPFAARASAASAAKKSIGALAAELVADHRSVFIDLGTTALALAREVPSTFNGSVTTTSIHVAAELADRTDAEVFLTGGRVRSGDLALSGSSAVDHLAKVYTDVAFIGSGALHAEAGLTDYHEEEAAARQVAIRNSQEIWALVDSSKFGRIARSRVASLEQLTGIVSDTQPPADLTDALLDAGVRVLVPQS